MKEIRGNASPDKIVVKSRAGEKEIPVRGVFIELGYIPNTAPGFSPSENESWREES